MIRRHEDTPVMANQMLSVGRAIWDWAIPLGLAKTHPFDKVRHFDVPDRSHVPWPAWVIAYVREKAWPARTRPRTPARLYQRHVLAGLPNCRPRLQNP